MSDIARQSWGTTIFCDDVRMEVGGKITLVGIYPTEMLVHVPFPFVVPKLGLWVKYFEVPGSSFDDGKLYISLPGDEKPSIESDVPLKEVRAASPRHEQTDPEDEIIFQLQMPVLFASLVLKQPGKIKVRLQVGETVTRLGTLTVKEGPREAAK